MTFEQLIDAYEAYKQSLCLRAHDNPFIQADLSVALVPKMENPLASIDVLKNVDFATKLEVKRQVGFRLKEDIVCRYSEERCRNEVFYGFVIELTHMIYDLCEEIGMDASSPETLEKMMNIEFDAFFHI